MLTQKLHKNILQKLGDIKFQAQITLINSEQKLILTRIRMKINTIQNGSL